MNIIREFLYNKSFEDRKWYKIANLKDSSTLSSSNRTKLSNVVKLHSTKSHVWWEVGYGYTILYYLLQDWNINHQILLSEYSSCHHQTQS